MPKHRVNTPSSKLAEARETIRLNCSRFILFLGISKLYLPLCLFFCILFVQDHFSKIWIEYTRNIIAKLVFAVKRLRQFHENIIKSPCKRPFPLLQGQCVDFILRFQISNRYPDQHTAQQDTVPHLFLHGIDHNGVPFLGLCIHGNRTA